MKEVCFIIPEGIVKPSSLFGAIEVFEHANEFVTSRHAQPYYNMKLAGSGVMQDLFNAQFRITAMGNLSKLATPDLIIIPGLYEKNNYSIRKNKRLLDWMVQQYKEGAELASLCTGAFLLAATGLLKNKECATHWKAEQDFIEAYPDVNLCTDKIITDSKGIYTAGGANSSLNLILYLIEKYNGRDAALYCARILQIDIDRQSQAPYSIFEGQKGHDDDEIKAVQEFIETNITTRVSVELLADKFAISRRSLVRRFKNATNNTPIEYIQRVKIEAAKRRLERSRKNVNEVMYEVGYSDVKAFRTVFKKITGLSPLDYKNKYNQQA